jgi:hypothetical protein
VSARRTWELWTGRGLRKTRRFTRLSGRAVLYGSIVAAAIVAVIFLAESENIPAPNWWGWATGALFVLQAFVILVAPINGYRLDRRAARVETLRQINESCHILLLLATQSSGLPLELLSAYVWVPRGPIGAKRLRTIARARVEPRKSSGMVWRKGTGVIGCCWDRNAEVLADLTQLHVSAGRGGAWFTSMLPEDRYGMTIGEVLKTHRYKAVLASPLNDDDGTFIGCVAIDCEADRSFNSLVDAFNTQRIQSTIGIIEGLVQVL